MLTMYLITLMAISRSYSVIAPLKYRANVFKSRVNRVCLGVWLISFVLSLTPFLGWGKYESIEGQCWCALNSYKHPYNWFVYFIISFAVPLLLNAFILAITLNEIKKRKKIKQHLEKDNGEDELKANIDQSGRTVFGKHYHIEQEGLPGRYVMKTDNMENIIRQKDSKDDARTVATIKVDAQINGTARPRSKEECEPTSTSRIDKAINEPKPQKLEGERYVIMNHIQSFDPASKSTKRNHEEIVKTNAGYKGHKHKFESRPTKECNVVQINSLELKMKLRRKTQNNQNKEEHRITVLLILLFVSYVVCCGPHFVVWTIFALRPKSLPRFAFVLYRFLAGFNSFMNAILYGFVSHEIRANVLEIWITLFRAVFRRP